MSVRPLRKRIALSAGLAAAGATCWRGGEVIAATTPVGFVASGVGLGLFLTGGILLTGAVLQGRATGALNVLADPDSRAITLRALYAMIAVTLMAAGAATLLASWAGFDPAPVDLLLAFGATAFLATLAVGHMRLAR